MDSLEPPLASIDSSGELSLSVTRTLALQFDLSPDEILNGLPLMDMSRTPLWDECPAHVKHMPCTVERYRTFTGHCNNLKNPSWGAAFTPFVRYLPPVYANGELNLLFLNCILKVYHHWLLLDRFNSNAGIDLPRVSVVDGSPLPSPRLITQAVHRDHDHPQGQLSILLMSWGQFIDHDLTLAAPPRGMYSAMRLIRSDNNANWIRKVPNDLKVILNRSVMMSDLLFALIWFKIVVPFCVEMILFSLLLEKERFSSFFSSLLLI